MNKRVVITGLGAVTPIGNNTDELWESILTGKSGINEITSIDVTDFKVKIAGEVKDFDINLYIDKKEVRRTDKYAQFGIAAAIQAYKDSELNENNINPDELAVMVGSGIGGMGTFERECNKLYESGPNKVSPFLVPMIIANILAGNIAIRLGAKGSCRTLVTACATGTDCIGEAYKLIKYGEATAAIAGSAEAPITKMAISGFTNMKALSIRNEIDNISTPFDKNRDGFVIGEGAGIVILEEYEHAIKRGAKIYAEVVGYGATCDAYHMTAPNPDGYTPAKCMEIAIKSAGITPRDISYINAHGTATPLNDNMETMAIKKTFGDFAGKVPVSSTKSNMGHLLGAAGSVEAIICIKALMEGYIPPTINYKTKDEELDLDYVPNVGRKADLKYAMSNSFGFGGHNATLVLKKY